MKIALIVNPHSGGWTGKKLLPDGEMIGTTPTEITILPKLVRYFH